MSDRQNIKILQVRPKSRNFPGINNRKIENRNCFWNHRKGHWKRFLNRKRNILHRSFRKSRKIWSGRNPNQIENLLSKSFNFLNFCHQCDLFGGIRISNSRLESFVGFPLLYQFNRQHNTYVCTDNYVLLSRSSYLSRLGTGSISDFLQWIAKSMVKCQGLRVKFTTFLLWRHHDHV